MSLETKVIRCDDCHRCDELYTRTFVSSDADKTVTPTAFFRPFFTDLSKTNNKCILYYGKKTTYT